MRALIVVLLVLSFVLPTFGFGRLLWRTQAEVRDATAKVAERGSDGVTWDDLGDDGRFGLLAPLLKARRDLVWDIVLVGLGMLAGAVAGILPLFIAVSPPS